VFTYDIHDLAAGLKIARHTILAHRAGLRECKLLEGLPEPIMSRPRLLWLRADIEAWIESRRTYRPTTPEAPAQAPRRGPGRPRKVAMQKGGV
jgi:hypothetical protein